MHATNFLSHLEEYDAEELSDLKDFAFCRGNKNDYFAELAASGRKNASGRVFVQGINTEQRCPGLVMVGIDLSQTPGLAGINFFGRASAQLLSEVDEAFKSLEARLM